MVQILVISLFLEVTFILSFLAVVLLTKIYMGVYRQKRHREQMQKEDAHDA